MLKAVRVRNLLQFPLLLETSVQCPLQLGDSLAHQILTVAPVLQVAASGHLTKPSRRYSGC